MISVEIEKEDIQRFATKIAIHPAIVAGRLANRGVMKQREGNGYGIYIHLIILEFVDVRVILTSYPAPLDNK